MNGKRLRPGDLRNLPAILTVKILRQLGYDWPSQSLARLAKSGLIDRMGHGIFHNPLGGEWDPAEAVRAVIPIPIVAGPTVLHDVGVITQIPSLFHVISVGERSAPSIKGVQVTFRPARWLDRVSRSGGLRRRGEKDNPYPIMSLTPRAAWQDMVDHEETRGIGEDDLDWEALEHGLRHFC